MALCGNSLRVSHERLSQERVFVATDDADRPVGVGAIAADGKTADLALLFVEPSRIGSGIGRRLFRHAAELAGKIGCREMTIAADPGAAAFYEAAGAVFAGMVPSDAIPGRELPLYKYAIRNQDGES